MRVFEVRLKHQSMRAGLLQRVSQFPGPISGIDIDEDGANCSGGELSQDPFFTIERPDPNPVSFADAQRQQPFGGLPDLVVKLSISQPRTLVADHQCFKNSNSSETPD